ncbi:MAG TPA: ATP-dependent protease ATPase subunit HslU [Ktedonobacterales bacterium]|nr:ATP-dependent protease ATPase subunit HslU [Ktedonobacterales bacterium]
MKNLTPQQIVEELDRYIVGQAAAKRAVAVALRNRYRRLQLAPEVRAEITPKNILMIGPTGVGKTEIARRLAKLADAPFVKVEATKFTEVGYVGRDAESIVRDLMDASINMVHTEKQALVQAQAEEMAHQRILNYLLAPKQPEEPADGAAASAKGRATKSSQELVLAESAAAEQNGKVGMRAAKAAGREQPRVTKAKRKRVAEMLANHQLEEQIIEIDLDADDGYTSILEFVAGMAADDTGDGNDFQELIGPVSGSRKRSRRVSVKEARRLLTQEEANKLIDFDQVVEDATKRVEESGLVFLDELDKIAGAKVEIGPDVSGQGVQRDLLPIVEGSTVMTRYGPVKTDHILWIAAGAFYSSKPSDLIPELQGRFPLRVELEHLSQADFKAILTQPDNALTKQYQALLGIEEVQLVFTEDGLEEMAGLATQMNQRLENIGARRLHTILEKLLEDLSFEAPDLRGQTVTVDRAFVKSRLEGLMKNEDLSKYIL